jgi:hypothetical protein
MTRCRQDSVPYQHGATAFGIVLGGENSLEAIPHSFPTRGDWGASEARLSFVRPAGRSYQGVKVSYQPDRGNR